ncbi:DUF2177 family protein [Variovorax sp. Root473]|uniref:DUF2177 family protein n=1 Tax=Variovorax sp. Root473 TaxID=1736541 RepID=UPI0006F95447|nr:DUF2177 family protein [Variovorax sp. Root473]KQX87102.1 hypothetical protein ASD34_12345 [Variovorax sp. Root473]
MKPSPRTLLSAYLAALACFLVLDAVWLSVMGPRLYQPALGALMAPQVNWAAAVLFYVLYGVGLVVFAIAPALGAAGPAVAWRRGALFGLVAYATYDLTNQATLRDWSWAVTAADLAWGTAVSGVSAWVAARITSRPARRRNVQ